MKALMFFCLAVLMVACAEVSPPPPDDELSKMLSAQDQATAAAHNLQRAAAQATNRADATREALVLNAQGTRLVDQARATQTILTLNAQATSASRVIESTREAQRIQSTAIHAAEEVHASETMRSIQVTQTTEAAHYTATAAAQNARSTQAAASATATAQAQAAQATRVAANATSTVIAAQVAVEQEKAEWNRKLESGRAIALFVFVSLVLIAFAMIVGWAVIRFVDAGVLRARVLRDKTGTVMVITEPDREGRREVLVPGRSPGAAIKLTPPDAKPLEIATEAVDQDTTKRDQAVSLMIAANSPGGNRSPRMENLLEEGQVRILDEPPPHLVAPDIRALLDSRWKELGDGHG